MLVLFAVAQVFLSESLISTLVQNTLTFVLTAWFGYMNIFKESKSGGQRPRTVENGEEIAL